MDEIDFKDLYVEGILREIKDAVKKKINLDGLNSETLNICSSKVERADSHMREVLKDILLKKDNNSKAEYNYNYLLLSVAKNGAAAKGELRSYLNLYYTALIFDNVKLLQRMIRDKIGFDKHAYQIDIELLDSKWLSVFDLEEFLEIININKQSLLNFYMTTAFCDNHERNKYFKKIANIFRQRKDLVKYSIPGAWTKTKLDVYDEETYKKASIEQVNVIIDNFGAIYDNAEFILRINKLIQETDFYTTPFFSSSINKLLDVFSNQELSEMDRETIDYFCTASYNFIDFHRLKGLVLRNPKLIKYQVTHDSYFLHTFKDYEIIEMDDEILKQLDTKRYEFFPEEFDKKAENKVRKFFNKTKVKRRFLINTSLGE